MAEKPNGSGTNAMTEQTVSELKRMANQKRWLQAYATVGNVTKACEIAEVGHTTVYDWLNADEGFKASYAQSAEIFTDSLEQTMWDRLAEPEGNRGSDILLMFALKARRPDIYRDLAIVVDDKAIEAMSEVKALVSKMREKQAVKQRDRPEVSVQEQAEAVVRAKGGGKA